MPGIINHKRKTVYWYIPKVACTSMKLAMAEDMGIAIPDGKVHADGVFEITNDFNAYSDYFHFTIRRNPVERALSLFNDKIRPDRLTNDTYTDGIENVVFAGFQQWFWPAMTFEQFVLILASLRLRDPHIAPQWTQHPQVNIYVIWIESLSLELKKVVPWLPPLGIHNQSVKRGEVTELARLTIRHHYAKDFL